MPIQLDPNLIGQAASPAVPLNDLSQVYSNALQLRQGQNALQQSNEAMRQQQVIQQAYKAAARPDGSVDPQALQQYVAQNGAGNLIPGMQKAQLENQATQAGIADKTASTAKTDQETLFEGLKQVDNTVASLAANPNATAQMVYGEMGRLVNAGAFTVQAKHAGTDPDTYAKQLLSTMPVNDPAALHNWLVQQGARVADATQRFQMSVPKYDAQNQGGQINEGTINQMTGQRTAGTNVPLTPSPDAVMSNATTIRGQDLTNARAGQANAIQEAASQSQIMPTPQGYSVVNRGTGIAKPVLDGQGQPVLTPDSPVAKSAGMADRLNSMIPMARNLLEHATHSGIGALADQAIQFVGGTTKGADAASALDTLSAWMTSNVPRFEGSQSDADAARYKIMAGMVGDRSKPVSTRLAALDTMQQLMGQFQGQRVAPYVGPPGTAPATSVAPASVTPGGAQFPSMQQAIPQIGPLARPSLDSFFKQ